MVMQLLRPAISLKGFIANAWQSIRSQPLNPVNIKYYVLGTSFLIFGVGLGALFTVSGQDFISHIGQTVASHLVDAPAATPSPTASPSPKATSKKGSTSGGGSGGNSATTPLPTMFVGGFQINTVAKANNAAALGIKYAINYALPPDESSSLGQAFKSLGISVIDSAPMDYLTQYECHKLRVTEPPSYWQGLLFCDRDYPYLPTEDSVLANLEAHLKSTQSNALIKGFWVLDDWPAKDPGTAKSLLERMHNLIARYRPGLPAICGFGGSIGLTSMDASGGYKETLYDNFTATGCDTVAFYIYPRYITDSDPLPNLDLIDWSLANTLPGRFAALAARGWDKQKTPLIGVPQGYSRHDGPNVFRFPPRQQDLTNQIVGYCRQGAIGIAPYAWLDSTDLNWDPVTLSPMNSLVIANGIKVGLSSCRTILHMQ